MSAGGLLGLSRRLHEARTLADAMRHVVEAIAAETRYARAWLVLPLPGPRGLDVVGFVSPDPVLVARQLADHDRDADRLLAHLLSCEETLVIEDLREEPRADQAQVAYFGNRTSINVPMLRLGERVGVLVVGTFAAEGVRLPTADELAFIEQVAALVTSVAARIRAEDAQREAEQRAQAAQRLELLGRMAGEVAHDFNSLLVSILCNAELALEQLGGHEAAESVHEIRLAADRAAALTKRLLTFSRGQPLARRPLDVGAVLEAFLPVVRPLLPAEITLTPRLPRGHWAQADAGQLEQILLNLVVNARDAQPSRGAIRVAVERAALSAEEVAGHAGVAPGEFVVLSVADDGHGMPAEVASRVFEPFYTTKEPGRGTGLGLAVVEGAARAHHGFVALETAEGRGTTFRVHLPATDAPAITRGPPPRRIERARRGTGHLLVVDDDAAVRATLERVLSGAGYRVSAAPDGAAALALVHTSPELRLVITDLVMPRLSGGQLRAELATLRPELPVLVLTGYTRGASAAEAGPHVLAKPFAPAELLDRIGELLDDRAG
ncbi:MAG: response regulator [Polyangiaceae bacterium]|nr:response regulator [Polyangiaceae bacterium]